MSAQIEEIDDGSEVKSYDLSEIPAYRKPVIEELIISTEFFRDGFDTPENLDGVAQRIFHVITDQHLLDAHLRENLQPDYHD